MSVWHLLWIVPLSAIVGFLLAALCCSAAMADEQMSRAVRTEARAIMLRGMAERARN